MSPVRENIMSMMLELASEFEIPSSNIMIQFNNKTSILGSCRKVHVHISPDGRYIPQQSHFLFKFSDRALSASTEEDVRDTVTHEFAHALTDPRFRGHGPEWKAMHRSLGGTGNTSAQVSDEVKQKIYKHIGECGKGHSFGRSRMTEAARRGHCPRCVDAHGCGDTSKIVWTQRW